MSSFVRGIWLDTHRGLTHVINGNAAHDGSVWWSEMTRCRHVRTVPARAVVRLDGTPITTPITCLWCACKRGD